MTAVAVDRPVATGRATRNRFTGTGTLIRLNLRRERIPLIAWVLGIGAVAASTFPARPASPTRPSIRSTEARCTRRSSCCGSTWPRGRSKLSTRGLPGCGG